MMLRDRLVCGVSNKQIQTSLLAERNLDLANATVIAVAMESAARDAINLQGLQTSVQNGVLKIQARQAQNFKKQNSNRFGQHQENFNAKNWKQESPSTSKQGVNPCIRCGGTSHRPTDCPFMNAKCYHCGKQGHIKKVCLKAKSQFKRQTGNVNYENQGKKIHSIPAEVNCDGYVQNMSDNYELFNIQSLWSSPDPMRIEFVIDDKPLTMELDTGAAFSLISESTYQDLQLTALSETKIVLSTFTGQKLSVCGSIDVDVKFREKCLRLPLLVVSGCGPSLCGRNWIAELELLDLKSKSIFNVPQVQTGLTLQSVLQKHEAVFDGTLGHFKEVEVQLIVKPGIQPKFCKARSIPFAMRDKVSLELDRLHSEGIIKPVRVSEWAAPIVPVLKADNTSVRICGDFKVTANQAIDTDQYPLPKANDIFASLAGGQKFSKLDLKDAYNQLELHQDSRKLLVINTHKGLFEYTRLPFGISSAPAIFQRYIDILLKDIPHVAASLDDVLITGPNDSAHLASLEEALQRIEKAGLKLKRKKCEFMKDSLIFLGHRLDSEGLHPTEEKLLAIEKAPEPRNVSELRSFLGLLTYYSRFLPNMADMLAPLYSLLQNNTQWYWGETQIKTFERAKEVLKGSSLLIHYDSEKTPILACDASPHGLGAVLSHEVAPGVEKPVAFASRTLSKAEQNYSQLEKEALALVFGVTKFRDYLLGKEFELLTDHRPLVSLLAESKNVPTLAASRIQRWALTLAAYKYFIKYRCGKENGNADALSRLPLEETVQNPPRPAELVLLLETLNNGPINADRIRQETRLDPVLSQVLNYLLNGWPLTEPEGLKDFYHHQNELSSENGIVLWWNRIVIPTVLRSSMLHELHDGHQGMTSMKRVARSLFWWPGLDKSIENVVRNCGECQENAPMPASTPVVEWEKSRQPWSRLHIDYAGPVEGKMILIVVDSYSKWIEALPVKCATSTETIIQLVQLFARFGVPDCIVSDNGSCFTSEEFQAFIKHCGIRHLTTAPYHPASNGLAERSVRIVKTGLKKVREGEFTTRLSRILMNHRRTPLAVLEASPSELLNGRTLRTRLDKIQHDPFKQDKSKTSYSKSFKNGDCVYFRNYGLGPKWQVGRVTSALGNKMYSVKTRDNSIHRRHVDQLRAKSTLSDSDSNNQTDQIDFQAKNGSENVLPFCFPLSGRIQQRYNLQVPDPVPVQRPVGRAQRTPPRRTSTRPRKPPNRLNI